MSRVLVVLLGVVVAGLLGVSPASANPTVVRIADPALASNVTAMTQLNNVRMEATRGTDLQRWRMEPTQTAGVARFVNVATGGCLSVFNRLGGIDGSVALQEYCVPNWTWQQWQVVQSGSNVRLRNIGTDSCLTVDPTATGPNPYLVVYACGTQPRQDFRLV